ncbi:hypothetical protein ES703_65219 [subsurface metagenome]
MKWRVLITCPYVQQTIDAHRELFAERGIEIELPHLVQQLNESELLEIIDHFDGVIAGDDEFTARVLEKGMRLKVIAKGNCTNWINRSAAGTGRKCKAFHCVVKC